MSQAYGAGARDECHRWLLHGLYLAVIASAPVMAVAWELVYLMPAWGLHPTVLEMTAPYLRIVTWSTLPLLLYAALRRYLQAMNLVRPIMVVLITANLVNVVVNWLLIFGHLGFPAIGNQRRGMGDGRVTRVPRGRARRDHRVARARAARASLVLDAAPDRDGRACGGW